MPKNVNFESLVSDGENPNGTTLQTPNGTAKAGNHPGWNKDSDFFSRSPVGTYEDISDTPWENGNRTGE